MFKQIRRFFDKNLSYERSRGYSELSSTIINIEDAKNELINLGIYDEPEDSLVKKLLKKWKAKPEKYQKFSKEEMVTRLLIKKTKDHIFPCLSQFNSAEYHIGCYAPGISEIIELFADLVSLNRQVNQWNHLAQEKFDKQSDKDRLKNAKTSFDEDIIYFKKTFNSIYIKEREFSDKAFELEEIIDSLKFELSKDKGAFTKSYFENKIQMAHENIKFISGFSFDTAEETERIGKYCERKKNQLNSLERKVSARNYFESGNSSFLKSDFLASLPSTSGSSKNEPLPSSSLDKKPRSPLYKKKQNHLF